MSEKADIIVPTPMYRKDIFKRSYNQSLLIAREISRQLNIPDGIPKELADLMRANDVDESDIRLVVSQRGYFTYDTPVINYPPDFIQGCLVAAWAQMLPLIRENQAVPFTVSDK